MATGVKTGGRKKGTKNRTTVAKEFLQSDARRQMEEALGPDVFEGDAHAFLAWCYKNTGIPLNFRIDSAGKAVAYEKPKLMAHTVEGGKEPIKLVVEWKNDE